MIRRKRPADADTPPGVDELLLDAGAELDPSSAKVVRPGGHGNAARVEAAVLVSEGTVRSPAGALIAPFPL